MQKVNRAVYNTSILYIRMLFTAFVSFYSTRLILNALGVEDYGIYNLLAGFTAMLSFLSGVLTLSSQRFLSFELGAKNLQKLQLVFNTSVRLHFFTAIAVVILLELIGFYMLNYVLEIPNERFMAAQLVFQFMVLDFFFLITSAPYDALITSHENIPIIASIYTFESLAKLGIALLLSLVLFDKLIFFSFSLAIIYILSRVFKQFYCRYKYTLIKYEFFPKADKELLKEMFSFSLWNSFGAFADIIRSQGIGILLNIFFGVTLNAAYGIALQVNGQLKYFANSLLMSLNPQILKAEGEGNRSKMFLLAMSASKYSFYLLCFFSIPVVIEMPFVLDFWLKNVPDKTVLFCRLVIFQGIMVQLTMGLHTAIQSIGNVKYYQIFTAILFLATIPIGYFLLWMGKPASVVIVVSICLEICAMTLKVLYLHKKVNFPIIVFLKDVIYKGVVPIILAITIISSISILLENQENMMFKALKTFVLWVLISPISIYIIGLYKSERIMTKLILHKTFSKLIFAKSKQF